VSALEVHPSELMGEIERLQTENWQLKQACGYPIPADKETINNPFKCGMCDARSQGESMTEGDRLAKFNQIRSTLAFFRSVIQCGEEWSSTCDREYEMAKAHLGELTAALSPPGSDDAQDAARYRRLRILGCAPAYTRQLAEATVMRFTNLDGFVDGDIALNPSRGEASLPREASGDAS
jgi:hypothetical protein